MSKVQTLRVFVNQRLTAAAEEIFELFERTIAEYEEQLCRQNKLLDAVFKPEVQLHRADVQKLLVSKEEDPPEQQEWSSSLDQEDPPELPHIKEEQEELWTNQEGEQLQGPEEADIIKSTLTPVPVKSEEDDEEKLQSSQLHQTQTEKRENLFSCSVCGKAYVYSSHLTRHLRIHTGEKPFTCSVCGINFTVSASLTNHMRVHTGEKFTCSVCGVGFTFSASLTKHMKLHEGENPYTSQEGEQLQGLEGTDIIKSTFTPVPVKSEDDDEEKPQSSQLHQTQTEDMKTEVDGEDCGGPEPARSFNLGSQPQPSGDDKMSDSNECETDNSCDWEETREPQSGFNSLVNNEVPVSDAAKTSVDSSDCSKSSDHMEDQQTELESFSCAVCGKIYPRKKSLSDHMRIHLKGRQFSCTVCKKRFMWKGELVRHMKVHTGEKPFSCTICGHKFAHRSHLGPHMRIHTGEKPFTCSVCKASFSSSSCRNEHMRVHTGEKPFSCSICGNKFTRKGTLNRHLTLHTGEKPFSCSLCDKRFALQIHLRKHLILHTGERPFSCSICGRKFAQKIHLSIHMTVHTGEKPYSCSVCGRKFGQKVSMTKHMVVHTREKKFPCTVCGQKFPYRSHIKRHQCAGKNSQLQQDLITEGKTCLNTGQSETEVEIKKM